MSLFRAREAPAFFSVHAFTSMHCVLLLHCEGSRVSSGSALYAGADCEGGNHWLVCNRM